MVMSRIVEKWRAFREWQKRPYQVAEKSPEFHYCYTCGEEYQGNFCPRCGQSAKIGRYSFKNAMQMFFEDVLGMGNRGMFRTMRDLLLRPGYLIRDYISGMQMAYFPPFKLLFLLTALLLIVQSGVNLSGENYLETYHEKTVNNYDHSITEEGGEEGAKMVLTQSERQGQLYDWYILKLREFRENNPAFFWLSLLFVLSAPLYIFFRKSTNISDLRFSELLIAMVYIWGMLDIYEIVFTFIGVSVVYDAVYLLSIIPLKQLFGFKWWRTILYLILSFLTAIMILFVVLWSAVQIQIYLEAL